MYDVYDTEYDTDMMIPSAPYNLFYLCNYTVYACPVITFILIFYFHFRAASSRDGIDPS